MKPFRSIRWRLQLWHGLLLAAVLAGFAATGHRLRRTELFREVDARLDQRLGSFVTLLQPPGPPRRPGPPDGGPDAGPGGPGPDFPRPPGDDFQIPQGAESFLARTPDDVYFVVWDRNAREIARSGGAPDDMPPPPGKEVTPWSRMQGTRRETFRFLPSGGCVLVGHDLGPELDDLARFGWMLSGVGGAVFACGLAGGWWITGRALHPLAEISATAGRIAHGDLTQRIPTAETDDEMGQLAAVLNETFDRLEASFARQARFTADASHELRTPISVLITQTQAMLARERTPEEYRACLASCERAAQRMRRLVETLLALARMDSGDAAGRRERCDLATIAADTVALLRPLAGETKVTLNSELATASCPGDPDQLAQVATNLIGNAIQHNRPGGEVTVATTRRDGSVVLSVRDTGPGIAEEDRPHIFERFYRADKARAGAAGRTGLGLAITQSIVEAHGGTLEFNSELGHGSVFTATFPAAET